jgi:hypothetical protein
MFSALFSVTFPSSVNKSVKVLSVQRTVIAYRAGSLRYLCLFACVCLRTAAYGIALNSLGHPVIISVNRDVPTSLPAMRQPHQLEDTCCHSPRSATRHLESGIQFLVVSIIGCVLYPTCLHFHPFMSNSFGCYVSFLEVGGASRI